MLQIENSKYKGADEQLCQKLQLFWPQLEDDSHHNKKKKKLCSEFRLVQDNECSICVNHSIERMSLIIKRRAHSMKIAIHKKTKPILAWMVL